MRLYLNTENTDDFSKYVPDWVKLEFDNEPDLVLDIQAEIDYSNGLNCRCKGNLIPWVLFDEEEVDLVQKYGGELNKVYPASKIVEMFSKANNIVVGIVPAVEDNADVDKIEMIKGCGELYMTDDDIGLKYHSFEFEIELNL